MNDPLDPTRSRVLDVSRRYFLGRCTGVSLGAMALPQLLQRQAAAEPGRNPSGGLADLPHLAARAKRVIFLTQSGGPSQLELFDEKPGLARWAGVELPESVRQGQRVTTMTSNQKQLVMPGRTKFKRCGRGGATIGEELLRPTRIYVREVMALLDAGIDVRGLAHITGDGLLNLLRVDAPGIGFRLDALPEPEGLIATTAGVEGHATAPGTEAPPDRKSTRLNSSH